MGAILNFWHTIVSWYALILTVVVLYDHWDKAQALIAWLGDKLRKK